MKPTKLKTFTIMKKVIGFKLSNGQIVDNKQLAIKLQKNIDFEKELAKFCDEVGGYSEFKDYLFNTITDKNYSVKLKNLLNKYL